MKKNGMILWAYISELILASLIVYLVVELFGLNQFVRFVDSASVDFATHFSVIMLAASVGFYGVFYSKSDTPFSIWLYEKGAYSIYEKAFIFAIGLYAFLSIVLVLNKHVQNNVQNTYISVLAGWLLVLGIINLYTFLKNVVGLHRLNMEFNKRNKT